MTPRTRQGLEFWAQVGILAVAAAVTFMAVIAVLYGLGLSPR